MNRKQLTPQLKAVENARRSPTPQEQEKMKKELDLHMKVKIARRITMSCEMEAIGTKKYTNSRNTWARSEYYTGLSRVAFTGITFMTEKTAKELLEERDSLNRQTKEVIMKNKDTYQQYRNIMIDFYINKRTVVTTSNIRKILNEWAEFEEDKLLWLLQTNGFILEPLIGTNKSIIIEKPEQSYERHQYLQKILKHRENKRCIVYLGCLNLVIPTNLVNNSNHDRFRRQLIAATATRLINCTLFKTIPKEFFNKWLLNTVLPNLPEKSVIVLDNSIFDFADNVICKVPTMTSTKREMTEWLHYNSIPHASLMHKAALFALIEKSKTKSQVRVHKIEEIFRSYEHESIVKPAHCKILDLYGLVYDFLWPRVERDKGTFKHVGFSDVMAYLKSFTIEHWKEFDRKLYEVEKKIYREDMEMEEVIDKLFTMAKYGVIPQIYLDDLTEYSPADRDVWADVIFS